MADHCAHATLDHGHTYRCALGQFGGMPHIGTCRVCRAGESVASAAAVPTPFDALCAEIRAAGYAEWLDTRLAVITKLNLTKCQRRARRVALAADWQRIKETLPPMPG